MASTPYDTNIKFLLADKQILARILKYAVQEFKDMTIEDIMSSEGRMQTMCNWSEAIKEMSFEEGVKKERLNAIERMIQANFTKEQIISCGYTEDEFAEAENLLCINA